MNNTVTETILINQLNGRLWEKGQAKRIYLNVSTVKALVKIESKSIFVNGACTRDSSYTINGTPADPKIGAECHTGLLYDKVYYDCNTGELYAHDEGKTSKKYNAGTLLEMIVAICTPDSDPTPENDSSESAEPTTVETITEVKICANGARLAKYENGTTSRWSWMPKADIDAVEQVRGVALDGTYNVVYYVAQSGEQTMRTITVSRIWNTEAGDTCIRVYCHVRQAERTLKMDQLVVVA